MADILASNVTVGVTQPIPYPNAAAVIESVLKTYFFPNCMLKLKAENLLLPYADRLGCLPMRKSRFFAQSFFTLWNFYGYLLPMLGVLQFFVHPWLYGFVKDLHYEHKQLEALKALSAWSIFSFW